MWITRQHCLMENMYYQGSQLIGHGFIKHLIDKQYWITAKQSSSGNPN